MEHETGGPHSAGQFGRYLLVGAWNTLFGYGSFAFFTAILSPVIPHSYIVASVIASLLNISVSYLGYKWFVFKTKGNYVREWIRCVGCTAAAFSSECWLYPCWSRSFAVIRGFSPKLPTLPALF